MSQEIKTITGMAICMFLAVLDIHVLSSSLPTISAELGYTLEETTITQTSYLIAEILSIILGGLFAARFGVYRVYLTCIILFALASLICMLSVNLEMLILARALQGLAGGLLISLCMASIYLIFKEAHQQLKVSSFISSVTTIAPVLGPIAGGIISEFVSWRMLFLINIPLCIVALLLMRHKLDVIATSRPKFKIPVLLTSMIGVCFITIFVALEEGIKFFWSKETIAVLIGSCWLIWLSVKLEAKSQTKVVNFALLNNSRLLMLMIALMLFSISHFAYLYMLILIGNDLFAMGPKDISVLIIVTGLAQMFSSFVVPFICHKIGMANTILCGIALLVVSVLLVNIDIHMEKSELFLPQALRGISFMLLVIPLQNMIMQIPDTNNKVYVSSQFNIFKNLGGALTIAFMSTVTLFSSVNFQQKLNSSPHHEQVYVGTQFLTASMIEEGYKIESLSSISILNLFILVIAIAMFITMQLVDWRKNGTHRPDSK